jgi:hypothetical protein
MLTMAFIFILILYLLLFSHHNSLCISHLSHTCNMSCPSHPPRSDYCNYIWREVQVMKPLIMQFSAVIPEVSANNYQLLNLRVFSNVSHTVGPNRTV